jgi:hypothetical protein
MQDNNICTHEYTSMCVYTCVYVFRFGTQTLNTMFNEDTE